MYYHRVHVSLGDDTDYCAQEYGAQEVIYDEKRWEGWKEGRRRSAIEEDGAGRVRERGATHDEQRVIGRESKRERRERGVYYRE